MQANKSNQAGERTQDINAVVPGSAIADFAGKTVVLRKTFFKAEYREGDRRFNAGGGFGCSPSAIGRAVFGSFVCDGESARVDRHDIEGVAVHQVTKVATI